jgi:hypothetical protein
MTTVTQPKIHNLYRCFDEDGNLLYVGISWSAPLRFQQHSRHSFWWQEVTRITLERFPSRTAAEAAEQVAIRTEAPRYNSLHAVEKPLPRGIDPAHAAWQVVSARLNEFGTWNVDLLPPTGHPEISINGIGSEDILDAIQGALGEGLALLTQFVEEQI